MKLTDLLNEDVYVKNKKTGNVYQVKNANPAKHTTPSKGEVEKAKTSDDNGSPKGGELKSEPKSDSPEVKAEKRKNLVDGNFDGDTTGQDHADMLAKEVNMMDGQEAQKAIQHLLDKNNFDDSGRELKNIKYGLERVAGIVASAERQLEKAYDSDDEDKQMELTDRINDGLAELGEMLEDLVENDDFSMANEEEYGEKNESIREGKSMKLKDLLNEQNQSKSYQRLNIGEEEQEEKKMTSEEKKAFLEAVSAYKKFGETIYRNGDLMETYSAIKGIVENANKVTLEETGDWFDRVTVNRHMKSMNESFKVFQKTLTEVHTLQQRLESTYDEIGEVLSKYYEIKEGNEFGAERAKAIAQGKDEFEVDGKKYPVKGVDKKDKENAKKFTNESKSMKLKDLLK